MSELFNKVLRRVKPILEREAERLGVSVPRFHEFNHHIQHSRGLPPKGERERLAERYSRVMLRRYFPECVR